MLKLNGIDAHHSIDMIGRATETLQSLHSPSSVRFMKTKTPRRRLFDQDVHIYKQNFKLYKRESLKMKLIP